jgi:hypothetical protein
MGQELRQQAVPIGLARRNLVGAKIWVVALQLRPDCYFIKTVLLHRSKHAAGDGVGAAGVRHQPDDDLVWRQVAAQAVGDTVSCCSGSR